MAEEQENRMYMYTYKLIFFKWNIKIREEDMWTDKLRDQKREKKYIKLYMLSSISTTVSKHSKFRKALIPHETQSEMDS